MEDCNEMSTPLPLKMRLSSKDCPTTAEAHAESAKLPYCTLVGKVMYLATTTRPDIAYIVRELAKYMSNYGSAHWNTAKHLLRYLQATRSLGLVLGYLNKPYPLFRAFTDSNCAGAELRKSISGYVMKIGNSTVAWNLKQLLRDEPDTT